MGITIGSLVGPPAGGVLYQRWGFRAPFIFGIIVTGIDLLSRLLLIERHEAMRWGVDPMAVAVIGKEKDPEVASGVAILGRAEKSPDSEPQLTTREHSDGSPVCTGEGLTNIEIKEEVREGNHRGEQLPEPKQSRVTPLPHIVLLKLVKSPRATVCVILSLIWGLVSTAQETTVVLHMNKVWGLDPRQAGIVFIATVVPAIFCEPRIFSPLQRTLTMRVAAGALSGWLGDRYGSSWVGCTALFLSLPWFGLITIDGPLAIFLTFFALEGEQ